MERSVTFNEAVKFCLQLDSKLFEPRNPSVQELISVEGNNEDKWLGITDQDRDFVFTYKSDDEMITWENWFENQPDNFALSEDCVVMSCLADDDTFGKWFDDPCTDKFQFICEKSLTNLSD